MKNEKFLEGTLIKGKDLKGYTLCKILAEDMVMQGFQYKMGMNEDVKPLATAGNCKAGLYFCFIKDVYGYLRYGNKLALIGIPDEEDVYVDDNKFRAHRLDIKKIMHLDEVTTWMYLCKNAADNRDAFYYAVENGYLDVVKYLHKQGADIMAYDNLAVRLAIEKGHLEVVKYLHKNGADIKTMADKISIRNAIRNGHLETVKYLYENGAITKYDNDAVICAAENGHLEVVEYLHKQGADIMVYDNLAVKLAAENGYLEVVEYLHKNGADITAQNNAAVRWASEGGHLEVVRYLHENGADITADNDYAVRWAAKNGHLDIVKYLQANV